MSKFPVSIDDISYDQAVDKIICFMDSDVSRPFMVVTPNVDHMQRLSGKGFESYKSAYKNADLVLCDSRILKIAARLKGLSIRNVIPGSDLTELLLSSDLVRPRRVCIIGPKFDEYNVVREKYNLIDSRHYCPPMGFINDKKELDKCIDFVITAKPDIVFLAIGSPQQEIVASKLKSEYDRSMVIMCIGASIDFLSGRTERAPKWMQKAHLEWFYRLVSEPKRLGRRYLSNLLWLANFFWK